MACPDAVLPGSFGATHLGMALIPFRAWTWGPLAGGLVHPRQPDGEDGDVDAQRLAIEHQCTHPSRVFSISTEEGHKRHPHQRTKGQQQPHAVDHHTAPSPRKISKQLPTNHSMKTVGTTAKPVFVILLSTLRRPTKNIENHNKTMEPIPPKPGCCLASMS